MIKWKKTGLIIFLLILVSAGVISYLYYKKPADIRKSTADQETTAALLLKDFSDNEAAANARYLDKVIVVEGNISKIELNEGNPTVFLDTGDPMAAVTCSFYETEIPLLKNLKIGTTVKIKGLCTGMLMDVVLNKCSIAE